MKTFQEFISESKKCWPGYKKKGTQKLFGKSYNRCVEEGKVPWDDPKHPLESGWTPAEKNRAKRARTGVEDPDTPQHKISDKDMTRYGSMKDADDTETEKAPKGKKTLFGKEKPPEHKNLHKFKKFPIRSDKGEEQTIGNARRSRGTPKPEATDEKSNMYQSPIKKGDKRTRGGKLDQWKGTNPRNEEVEYELEESSTGERSRGRATLGRAGNKMDRRERTVAAIAKKAGLRGTGKYSTKDLRAGTKDYTTYDSENDLDDVGSTEQDHYIRTHSSPRSFATGLMSKSKPAGRNAFGRLKHKVRPSLDSVRKVKDLRKSITKVGADKQGQVHIVDIMHRDSSVGKGDRTQQIERGKNFIQALKDTPKHLKKAQIEASKDTPKHLKRKPPRAIKKPLVGGEPTAVMSGESKKTGEAKRAKLYSKIFGNRSSKVSPKTGLMLGKAD
jgi:hypothetical protein